MDQSIVGCDGLGCDICDLVASLAGFISLLVTISFSLGLFFAIISGFMRIFTWGDERKNKLAKNGLKYSLIGLIICLVAYLMVATIFQMLGFKSDNWFEIKCNSNLSESQEEGKTDKTQYKNEFPLGEIGARDNPVLIDQLSNLTVSIPADQYFFIRGLSAQPIGDSIIDLEKAISDAKSTGKNIFAVLPASITDEGSKVEPRLINLGALVSNNEAKTTKNLIEFLKQFIESSPNGVLPMVTSSDKGNPPVFENLWPEDDGLKNLSSFSKGVVYEENPIFSDQKEADDSGFTINLKYDEKNKRYYLNPEKPVSLEFDAGVDRRVAEETTVQIAEAITALLPDNKYEDIYPVVGNLMGSAEKNSLAPLPSAVLKTSDSKGVTAEEIGILENFVRSKIINSENSETGIFSPSSVPQAPEDATILPDNPSDSNPKAPIVDTTSALPSTEISDRISAVSGYDISRLKRNVATDRILNPEERKELNKMLKGLQQEIAKNTRDMNIPSEFLMCVFEKESSFDGGARSRTGCSGIGQMCMKETAIAVEHMKKYAPEHFNAFFEKFLEQNKDFYTICTDKSSRYFESRRELLRSDPNFGAAVSYLLMDYKKRGPGNTGRPIANEQDLAKLANSYYGSSNSNYFESILRCTKNNSWLIDYRKKSK